MIRIIYYLLQSSPTPGVTGCPLCVTARHAKLTEVTKNNNNNNNNKK